MSETEPFAKPDRAEVNSSSELLRQVYDYLLDNYGEESKSIEDDYTARTPKLPKLTGWAAVKASVFGDNRPKPERPYYLITERMIGVPMESPVSFVVLTRKHEATRQKPRTTYHLRGELSYPFDTTTGVELPWKTRSNFSFNLESSPFNEPEFFEVWSDYLNKYKDFRSRVNYEESLDIEFITQNLDLVKAIENHLGLYDPNKERRYAFLKLDKSPEIDGEKVLDDWLKESSIKRSVTGPWPGRNEDTEYVSYTRGVVLKPKDDNLPTLLVTYKDSRDQLAYRYSTQPDHRQRNHTEEYYVAVCVENNNPLDGNHIFHLTKVEDLENLSEGQWNTLKTIAGDDAVNKLKDGLFSVNALEYQREVWESIIFKYKSLYDTGEIEKEKYRT